MGSIIGHEITHGFDDQGDIYLSFLKHSEQLTNSPGRQFDKFGNLVEWWSGSAQENFNSQKLCIVDQYDSFLSTDVNKTVNVRN